MRDGAGIGVVRERGVEVGEMGDERVVSGARDDDGAKGGEGVDCEVSGGTENTGDAVVSTGVLAETVPEPEGVVRTVPPPVPTLVTAAAPVSGSDARPMAAAAPHEHVASQQSEDLWLDRAITTETNSSEKSFKMSIDDKPAPLRIVIIGAGIAGLSAAIAPSKQGHRVVVLEKPRFCQRNGGSYPCTPNCTALLQSIDVDPKDFGGTLLEQEWYLVHHVDLHNCLKERLHQTTATLHLGCKITNINIESDQPFVTLEVEREFTCDLLLGADGLHTSLETQAYSSNGQPTTAESSPTPAQTTKSPTYAGWFLPTPESGRYREGDKTALANGFAGFAPSVRRLIDTAGDDLKVWELFDMEKLPTWVRGRAALVGESAHPFQPYMGQGAAMAIEDALSITTLLPLDTKVEDIPARLALYEKTRQPRVDFVLKYTRLNGADENDPSVQRMTATKMVKVMGVCFPYNEIEYSRVLLEEERGC
ncbi:hypothetical protein ETB97_010269 [Aspergillus alliaceus]|uniref:FAD-binding domain-containing protein n=1 Tax=Petromyces alliaceus TaxID=209559 RepID=A0A8H6E0E2_PETAA|nr:hypothetical protein ETB97_010269 [Aspergillus burnettii]